MHTPYTVSFSDAVAITQTSMAVVVTALVWRSPLRPKLACVPFLAAVWLAAIPWIEASFLGAVGIKVDPDHAAFVLTLSRFLCVLAFAIATKRWFVIPVTIGAIALWKVSGYLQESDAEIAVLHVAFYTVAFAAHSRLTSAATPTVTTAPVTRKSTARHDLALFVLATILASIVCIYVLERFCNSGDEWAYTYQADLFAHFKAYGEVPRCPSLFQNYWVFFYLGRAFSQYTPGWPLLLAPFQRLGIVWLASPLALGALAVAVARLARRAAASDESADARQIQLAGTIAGLAIIVPVGMLLNGASRFPHVPVAACFAWAIECACATAEPGTSRRAQWLWGAGLGFAASMMLAIRHGDGATLGVGLFFVYAYWIVRRRVGWRSLLGGALVFGAVGAACLVILRIQLGEWFKTGYSLSDQYWAFAKANFSVPKPNEFKYGIPLGTGAYMWWPCAPALGAAGMLFMRGRAAGIAWTFALSSLVNTALYTALEFGRGYDAGYGPRYQLPLVLVMAVGSGVLLAPVLRDALRRTGASLRRAGPAVLVVAALASGTLRIAPLIYPEAHTEIHMRDATFRAIAEAHLKHAVVTADGADVAFDPLDLAQNLPSVANPEVLIFVDHFGIDMECGRRFYGDRTWYKAVGKEEVKLVPK